MTDTPGGLRGQLEREIEKLRLLNIENTKLKSTLLMNALSEGAFTFEEGILILESYEPELDDVENVGELFKTPALKAWLREVS